MSSAKEMTLKCYYRSNELVQLNAAKPELPEGFTAKTATGKNGQRENSAAKIEMVGKKATQNYCLK